MAGRVGLSWWPSGRADSQSTGRRQLSPAALVTYVLVAALWIVTPGQDTAVTIRNTLRGGRVTGLATVAGIVTGQLLWVVLTAVGVLAALAASPRLFVGLELAGSVFLCYLGVRAVYSAMSRTEAIWMLPEAAAASI